MSDNFCEVFRQDDAAGMAPVIKFVQSLEGKPLAKTDKSFNIAAVRTAGSTIRTYADLHFHQQWTAAEAVYGCVRSVTGLAPGETVTIETSRVEQVELSSMVQNSIEATDSMWQESSESNEDSTSQSDSTSYFGPRQVEFGSILDIVEDVGLAVVTGGASLIPGATDLLGSAAGAIGNAVGGALGLLGNLLGFGGDSGSAPPLEQWSESSVATQTATRISEVLEHFDHSQTERSVAERSSTWSTTTEQRIARTFSNPYADRSIELRTIPVFRRYEVETWLADVRAGVVVKHSEPKFDPLIVQWHPDFLRMVIKEPEIVAGLVNLPHTGLASEAVQKVRSRRIPVPLAGNDREQVRAETATTSETDAHAAVVTQAIDHLDARASYYVKQYMPFLARNGSRTDIIKPVIDLAGETLVGVRGAAPDNAGSSKELGALAWSKTQVRGDRTKVPFAESANLVSALGNAQGAQGLADTLKKLRDPSVIGPIRFTRSVYVYMGTKIEAVSGECVLPAVPEVHE